MSELIAGLIAAAVPVGSGIGFVWHKLEKRFSSIEERLEECRLREIESQRRSQVKLTVIELLWQEIERNTPGNAVLRRARRLLDGLKREQDHDQERVQ